MPNAICENGHVTKWRNTRGSSMPRVCDACGADNVPATAEFEWDEQGHITKVTIVPQKRGTHG